MADQPEDGAPQVLYLEPDDEIPSVVRRLEAVRGAGPVILVAPGRSRATSSTFGLRLLARRAADAQINLRLVADAATRAVATEVGVTAYATIGEAQAGLPAVDPELPSRSRAAIHVVRGERTALPSMTGPLPARAEAEPYAGPAIDTRRADDTQSVPVVSPPQAPRAAWPRPRFRWPQDRRGWLWSGGVVVLVAAIVAAILPGATIHVVPDLRAVGPFVYPLQLPATADSGELTSTLSAPATGTYDASTPATGQATFANYSFSQVTVPKGTKVSSGELVFTTDDAIVIRGAGVFGQGATGSVGVTAAVPGVDGNVAADAIDTVDDRAIRGQLCSYPIGCPRLVANRDPLTGGETKTGVEISQQDVDGLLARIDADLRSQLTDHLSAHPERIYAPPSAAEEPVVTIPDKTVGARDQESFQLNGTLAVRPPLRHPRGGLPGGGGEDPRRYPRATGRHPARGIHHLRVPFVAGGERPADHGDAQRSRLGGAGARREPAESARRRQVAPGRGTGAQRHRSDDGRPVAWVGGYRAAAAVPDHDQRRGTVAVAVTVVPERGTPRGAVSIAVSRLLGIDHGRRRMGIAVADTETGVAFARPALRLGGRAGLEAVVSLARDERAELVIVGLPRNMDGSEGSQAAQARAFGAALVAAGIRVVYVDERLTTWEARRQLESADRRPSRASGELDSAAARLILQDYLDSGPTGPEHPRQTAGDRHHQEIG